MNPPPPFVVRDTASSSCCSSSISESDNQLEDFDYNEYGNNNFLNEQRPARFNEYIVRELPKSTEEKEMEMMEYYRSHPFRANPIRFRLHPERGESGTQKSSPKTARPVTEPKPFRFQSEARAKRFAQKNNNPTEHSRETKYSQSELDLHKVHSPSKSCKQRESENQKELPRQSPQSGVQDRKATIPQPFNLRINERIKQRSGKDEPEQKEEQQNWAGQSDRNRRSAGPFQLATDARHLRHQKQMEQKLRQEEEERKKQTEFRAKEWNPQMFKYDDKQKYLRKNNKHVYVPKEDDDFNKELQVVLQRYKAQNVGAFDLESVKRHEAYQKQLFDKLAKDSIQQDTKSSKSSLVHSYFSLATGRARGAKENVPLHYKASNSKKQSLNFDKEKQNTPRSPSSSPIQTSKTKLKTEESLDATEGCTERSSESIFF